MERGDGKCYAHLLLKLHKLDNSKHAGMWTPSPKCQKLQVNLTFNHIILILSLFQNNYVTIFQMISVTDTFITCS